MNDQEIAQLVKLYFEGRYTLWQAAEFLVPEAGVDLRSIPSEEWSRHLGRTVLLPPEVEHYVAGQEIFTEMECEALEKRIAAFHGVSSPYWIIFEKGPRPVARLRFKPRLN